MSGLVMTGVILHRRDTDTDHAFHEDCARKMLDMVSALQDESGIDAWQRLNNAPLVEIGPIFAPESEWTCAFTACEHKGESNER